MSDNKIDDTVTQTKANVEKNVDALEKWLEGINKQVPQLPSKAQEFLAKIAPWAALVGGILSLLSTWSFWQAGHRLNTLLNWANELTGTYSPQLGFSWYLALVLMAVQGILLLVAFPRLRDGLRSGWKVLLYISLLNLLIGLAYLFTPSYGFGSLLGTVIGSAIGFYLLFQIRGHFKK